MNNSYFCVDRGITLTADVDTITMQSGHQSNVPHVCVQEKVICQYYNYLKILIALFLSVETNQIYTVLIDMIFQRRLNRIDDLTNLSL